MYTGIELVAFFNCPEEQDRVKGEDTKKWIAKYMFDYLADNLCTPDDLYGARCGIVHTTRAISQSSQFGSAKKIYYAWGPKTKDQLQQLIDLNNETGLAFPLHINELLVAFCKGAEEYIEYLNNNPDKLEIAFKRSLDVFGNLKISL